MRLLVTAAVAAVLAAGCGPAAAPARRQFTAPSPVTLTSRQACQRLLADVDRNHGVPDIATLRVIADHVSAPRLASDARTAVRDLGHTGTAPVAFALIRDECMRAGVPIPARVP